MAPNFIRNHDTILFYSKNHNNLNFRKKYIENKDFKQIIKKEARLTEKMTSLGLTSTQQTDLLNFINYDNRPDRYPLEDTWNCNEYDDLNSIAIVSFSGEKISKILDVDQDFKGQKSIKMLKRVIESMTSDDDIIIDFFSGTASTAHAVIQLNSEDSGKRKFIMVQIPEQIDETSEAYKLGYENICEIGKERIRRAGDKIKDEAGLLSQDLDIGFRVLKIDSSSFEDTYRTPSETLQMNLENLAGNLKMDRTPEDLLFEILPAFRIPLSAKIETQIIAGKQVFNVNDGQLLACLDLDVSTETVGEIAKLKPVYAVFRDASFANDSAAANFEELFKTYSPDTVRKVV